MLKLLKSLLLSLLLAGCITTHEKRVEGWPKLQVIKHVVEPERIYPLCSQNFTALQKLLVTLPVACSGIDFVNNTCHIILANNSPSYVEKHEEMHCEGWDHDGVLQAGLDFYKKTGRNK